MIVLMQLCDLLEHWRPGSRDEPWTWHDEHAELTSGDFRPLMDELRADIAQQGMREPILLGHDGRVWDGHHRVVAARQLGFTQVPVEIVPSPVAQVRHHE